ncbi:MAG: globin-coupled sensor protein, partial [Rhodobacteraceae bacterium]
MTSFHERVRLFNLDGQSLDDLRAAGKIVIPELDQVLTRFYARVSDAPEAAAFFASKAMIEHARAKQKEHWTRLLNGQLDAGYETSVDRIGRVHARINLPLDQYMAAYANAASDVMGILLKRLNGGLIRRHARMADIVSAATRALALDIEEVTTATVRIWNEEQDAALRHLGRAIDALKDGNLTHRIPAPADSDFPVKFDAIRAGMNAALDGLSAILGQTNAAVTDLIGVIGQVATSSDQLSQRTNSQAASLEETAAAMEQLVQSVKLSAENIGAINNVAGKSQAQVSESVNVVQQSQQAMFRIKTASEKISQITALIDDIAFQTNLLALNA